MTRTPENDTCTGTIHRETPTLSCQNAKFVQCAILLLAGVGALILGVASVAGEVAVKAKQKIVFLGDSITREGMKPTGYITLTAAGLKANGIEVEAVGAGIGGHKAPNMLERLERDVLSKKPDWMTLSCGVNDVWHGANGVPLDKYKVDITAIVDRAQAVGIKVMIITATVIQEDLNNAENQKLAGYNDFLRALTKEKKCLLADASAAFHKILRASDKPGRVLTKDGVHLNPLGDQTLSLCILRAFGLNKAQLAKASATWAADAPKKP